MKDTGFPSPFIDIMMFSPASRTAAISAWKPGSSARTTLLDWPRSPISASSSASLASRGASASPWNSTISRLSGSPRSIASIVARKIGILAEVDHGAVDQFHRLEVSFPDVLRRFSWLCGSSRTGRCRRFARLDWVQFQLDRGGEGQRALGPNEQSRQVFGAGGARLRRQHVDVVAADAAKLAREARGDFLGLGRAEQCAGAGQGRRCLPAPRRRGCPG